MILTIIITGLSVVNLFLLNSVRHFTREIFWLAIMNGVFIIQNAHMIFDGVAGGMSDHPRMVGATFTILYLPALIIICLMAGRHTRRVRQWPYLCAISFVVFVFFYYGMFIARSIPLISYANLIWHAEIVVIIILSQELWSFPSRDESEGNAVSRSHMTLMKTWTLILLVPYFLPLAGIAFPADNFLIPYRSHFTTAALLEWLTAFLLIIFGVFILRHKAIISKERASSPLARNMEDLAF